MLGSGLESFRSLQITLASFALISAGSLACLDITMWRSTTLVCILATLLCGPLASAGRAVTGAAVAEPGYGEKKVDVDLFVMSKCP